MFGLISKLKALPGQRDALGNVLLQGTRAMPGCLHYIIAKDVHDENILWIIETWDSAQAHQSALALPSMIEALAQGKPLIAAIERRIETVPLSTGTCS